MKGLWDLAAQPHTAIARNAAAAPGASLWSGHVPSILAPTLDVAELDKRIGDLRAVAHWLEVNSAMLRTTIQSMEVQRATIATLQSMNSVLFKSGETSAHKDATPAPGLNPAVWWDALQQQFGALAAAATPPAPVPSAPHATAPATPAAPAARKKTARRPAR
jgi:hypothetical protein